MGGRDVLVCGTLKTDRVMLKKVTVLGLGPASSRLCLSCASKRTFNFKAVFAEASALLHTNIKRWKPTQAADIRGTTHLVSHEDGNLVLLRNAICEWCRRLNDSARIAVHHWHRQAVLHSFRLESQKTVQHAKWSIV
jgi:hypothetical protein